MIINLLKFAQTFKLQPHKMIKHTQVIRRLLPTNCLNVFDHFVGLILEAKFGDDPKHVESKVVGKPVLFLSQRT